MTINCPINFRLEISVVVSKVDVSLLFSTFDGPGKIINGAMLKFGV